MSTDASLASREYEFDDSQNELIGSLARKMGLVGIAMIVFGLLQLINGVASLLMSRDPERFLSAAEQAGMNDQQLAALRDSLSGDFWSSPLAVTAISFALTGLFLFLIGLWTRQAANRFGDIVQTHGRDMSRLMDALGALHRKYGLMYWILIVAAILFVLSLAVSFWQSSAS